MNARRFFPPHLPFSEPIPSILMKRFRFSHLVVLQVDPSFRFLFTRSPFSLMSPLSSWGSLKSFSRYWRHFCNLSRRSSCALPFPWSHLEPLTCATRRFAPPTSSFTIPLHKASSLGRIIRDLFFRRFHPLDPPVLVSHSHCTFFFSFCPLRAPPLFFLPIPERVSTFLSTP